jgi:hypothetical protein
MHTPQNLSNKSINITQQKHSTVLQKAGKDILLSFINFELEV